MVEFNPDSLPVFNPDDIPVIEPDTTFNPDDIKMSNTTEPVEEISSKDKLLEIKRQKDRDIRAINSDKKIVDYLLPSKYDHKKYQESLKPYMNDKTDKKLAKTARLLFYESKEEDSIDDGVLSAPKNLMNVAENVAAVAVVYGAISKIPALKTIVNPSNKLGHIASAYLLQPITWGVADYTKDKLKTRGTYYSDDQSLLADVSMQVITNALVGAVTHGVVKGINVVRSGSKSSIIPFNKAISKAPDIKSNNELQKIMNAAGQKKQDLYRARQDIQSQSNKLGIMADEQALASQESISTVKENVKLKESIVEKAKKEAEDKIKKIENHIENFEFNKKESLSKQEISLRKKATDVYGDFKSNINGLINDVNKKRISISRGINKGTKEIFDSTDKYFKKEYDKLWNSFDKKKLKVNISEDIDNLAKSLNVIKEEIDVVPIPLKDAKGKTLPQVFNKNSNINTGQESLVAGTSGTELFMRNKESSKIVLDFLKSGDTNAHQVAENILKKDLTEITPKDAHTLKQIIQDFSKSKIKVDSNGSTKQRFAGDASEAMFNVAERIANKIDIISVGNKYSKLSEQYSGLKDASSVLKDIFDIDNKQNYIFTDDSIDKLAEKTANGSITFKNGVDFIKKTDQQLAGVYNFLRNFNGGKLSKKADSLINNMYDVVVRDLDKKSLTIISKELDKVDNMLDAGQLVDFDSFSDVAIQSLMRTSKRIKNTDLSKIVDIYGEFTELSTKKAMATKAAQKRDLIIKNEKFKIDQKYKNSIKEIEPDNANLGMLEKLQNEKSIKTKKSEIEIKKKVNRLKEKETIQERIYQDAQAKQVDIPATTHKLFQFLNGVSYTTSIMTKSPLPYAFARTLGAVNDAVSITATQYNLTGSSVLKKEAEASIERLINFKDLMEKSKLLNGETGILIRQAIVYNINEAYKLIR